jgi:hypothetical protein
MITALIDNGSLEPAAHLNLRRTADALAARTGQAVHAVSWRHSDRIPRASLGGAPAATLIPWVLARLADGEREFLFIPFLISPQGAIASSLRRDLEMLRREEGDFSYSFTRGLADSDQVGDLAGIVVARIRETIALRGLARPAVIVVDHGGPERRSAELRDRIAAETRGLLGDEIGVLSAASMEAPEGPEFAFNRPLFAEQLAAPDFSGGDVVIMPLFLSPGRHAGPGGDLERIARAAEARNPGLKCAFCELVGTHPLALEALARGVDQSLPLLVLT